MRILLMNPQWTHRQYFGKFDEARSVQQPLGIAYLAAVLERQGHKVILIDAPAMRYDIEDIVRELKSFGPDLVGISVTTASFTKALSVAKEVKAQFDVTIIAGGPHVAALPDETLQNSCFDIGVIGEGELTIVELVDKLQSGGKLGNVRGIVYRDQGTVRRNPERPYIEDLDSVPFPARHLLSPLEVYRPTPSAYKCLPQATMITSRGCPYKCTFCDRSVFGSKYRARSARNVVDEMDMLVEKHGANEIRFWDDTFNIDSSRVIQICEEIQARGIDVPWTCLGRINHMSAEVLDAMAKSGCWQVEYGIESGSQRLLDGIKKGLTLDMIRTVTKMTHRAGIKMRGFFMLGLPGETEETMRQTIEFAKTLNLSAAVFHITTPFPGTELYRTVLECGELDTKTGWDNYSIFSSDASPYVPKGLSHETIGHYQTEAYRSFYIRPSFILRQVLGIRSISDIHRYMTGLAVVSNLR
jgi:anaerobic magnesium-protoporphyrin IX monomethyl ester cyclase